LLAVVSSSSSASASLSSSESVCLRRPAVGRRLRFRYGGGGGGGGFGFGPASFVATAACLASVVVVVFVVVVAVAGFDADPAVVGFDYGVFGASAVLVSAGNPTNAGRLSAQASHRIRRLRGDNAANRRISAAVKSGKSR
jgi:hypothetical protein